MSDFQPIPDDDNIWLRPRKKAARPAGQGSPWGTWILCTLCGGLYLLIIATGGQGGQPSLAHATYPNPPEIWTGAWWGPLTAAFVHFDFFHVLFNIYWLYYFGKAIEQYFGTWTLVALVVTSAYLASSFELAFAPGGSIGASGINYALFGFLWVARRRVPQLATVLSDRVVHFLLIWFVVGFFLSKAGIMPIGNAAHASGLAFGTLVAAVFVLKFKRPLTIPALALLVAVFLVPLIYMPWSVSWLAGRAYLAHDDGRFEEAIVLYDRILDKEPGDEWATKYRARARMALGLEEIRDRLPDSDIN